ncbi:hypothetical protein GGR52DRAFT_576777 [Hypoxylon sp. FL1284]|nr:hypothetical protein GGR52DRAFT_576777 [Hypoxylon sp. FL1284]
MSDPINPTFEEFLKFTGLPGTEVKKALAYADEMESEPQTSATPSATRPKNVRKKKANDSTKSAASTSKKRKSETSLDDEIAAYKRGLDSDIDPDDLEDDPVPVPSCQALRNRINKLLDAGIMSKTEFAKAIGCRTTDLTKFLQQKGTHVGGNSPVYLNAWGWFREREIAKLKMPDTAASLPDITDVHLEGEETDDVSVWDTCDKIRKKIDEHLKTPGVTQAQFCRDLFAQLNAPKIKHIQASQLADFRGQKGPRTGAKSTVFYAAYVYFEKLRIAQGKKKTKHREDMEGIWACEGGFDRTTDHRTQFIGAAGKSIRFDRYGRTV